MLVATTVIEVGIDVPNATVMLVEDAERYGISQLHQLRGRVGRGEHESLLPAVRAARTRARLRALAEHRDGFALAEIDLELRGEGELLGTRQSGLAPFRFARLPEDAELLERARARAEALLAEDPRARRRPSTRCCADALAASAREAAAAVAGVTAALRWRMRVDRGTPRRPAARRRRRAAARARRPTACARRCSRCSAPLDGARVLDLFAGSRRARRSRRSRAAPAAPLFVERDPRAVARHPAPTSTRSGSPAEARGATPAPARSALRNARAARRHIRSGLPRPALPAARRSWARELSAALRAAAGAAAARVVIESDRRAPLELALPARRDERRYGDTLDPHPHAMSP